MKSNALKIAIYARVSTESQEEDGQSLSTQLDMMTSAVDRMGATLAEVYQVQESAMPGSPRPSLTKMLKDAAAGRFDAVMVCKLDRLSRSIEVLTHVENSLRTFGIQLFEGQDEHNLRSAEGRLNRGMQALIGEYSVNRLKWSACASRLERARRGWPHSGGLPFGRRVKPVKDKRNADAEWELDPEKSTVATTMYRMYIEQGLNFAQVGKKINMHPETVRRIMLDQSGPVWVRKFIDPATGEHQEVRTNIPPLYSADQIELLRDRAKQNQSERAGWTERGREYPLSNFLRCANPSCNWSNLSGHQSSFARLRKDTSIKTPVKRYAYYIHLLRNRQDHACFASVPAELIEDEIFSRLGDLLSNSCQLVEAIRSALITDPDKIQELKAEHSQLIAAIKKARRVLANALEVLFEEKGTPAGMFAQGKVDQQNVAIAHMEERLIAIRDDMKVIDFPTDFPERFANTMFRMVGLNGHMPMHWPTKAKRALLELFFGKRSTRHDRAGRHQHTAQRGIFLTKLIDSEGHIYWRYEAKGAMADFAGALTGVVEIYDRENSEANPKKFSAEELNDLAALAKTFEGLLTFRSLPQASRRVGNTLKPREGGGTVTPIRFSGAVGRVSGKKVA